MVARLQAENTKLTTTLRAHDLVIQALRLEIAKLRKQAFGKSSEKIEREIEQLELALEDVLVTAAQQGMMTSAESAPEAQAAGASADTSYASRSSRRPRVSADTPRERHELDSGSSCPDCGGELRLVDEDASKILKMITAKLEVIEAARPKKSCRCCEKMVQAPTPSRPIPRSMAGEVSWLTCWFRNLTIICRCIGKMRSSRSLISSSATHVASIDMEFPSTFTYAVSLRIGC